MTTVEANAARIFADALRMAGAAAEHMDAGDVRDAAEKAWSATVRATEALVLARTGQEPGYSTETGRRLQAIVAADFTLWDLMIHYADRKATLYEQCLCHDYYQLEVIERLIRETLDFIRECERLARETAGDHS